MDEEFEIIEVSEDPRPTERMPAAATEMLCRFAEDVALSRCLELRSLTYRFPGGIS